jgi:hypothetical protein
VKGKVVSVKNRDRGFIHLRDDAGVMRFAHVKSFLEPLDFDLVQLGDIVEFTPEQLDGAGGNGQRAVEVCRCR